VRFFCYRHFQIENLPFTVNNLVGQLDQGINNNLPSFLFCLCDKVIRYRFIYPNGQWLFAVTIVSRAGVGRCVHSKVSVVSVNASAVVKPRKGSTGGTQCVIMMPRRHW
jgi:hypothetical protein